jgi:hypothetical protein
MPGTQQAVDVTPLLRAYREAVAASRRPPPSLRWKRLQRVTRWLRPSWGCRYFTVRHVQRRLDALDRALSGRIAVGDHDEDDEREHEALGRLRASLPPPPSRWLTVGGVVAIIVLAQALLSWFWTNTLEAASIDRQNDEIRRAFEGLDLAPDVQSIGDLLRALASGSYQQLGVVLMTVGLIAYFCMRPFASGYWQSRVLLGRPERLRRRQRGSPLVGLAAQIDVAAREKHVSRCTPADFKRDAPVDLLAKAVPWFVALFIVVGFTRLIADAPDDIDWGEPGNREVLAFYLAVAALTILRLAWLIVRLRQRRQAVLWILAPVAFIALLAVVAPLRGFETSPSARDELTIARGNIGFDRLPNLNRTQLRLTLGASEHLDGADLRAVDLPDAHLRGKTLRFADVRLADLRRADLRRADLRRAVLMGSLLNRADLRRADLRFADLSCVNLRGADLRGAKLAGTRLDDAFTDKATRWPAKPGRALPEAVTPGQTWDPWWCLPA